jgi:5-methylcytosine-specific restriction protein A
LVPVCPNCHAMLHSTRPAMAITELRGLMSQHRRSTRSSGRKGRGR